MDRLGKKCIIASGVLHGTLVVALLAGPAFLASNRQPAERDIIDFIPSHVIDANMVGGGNPAVATPPPARPPEQQPVRQPDPPPVRPPERQPVRQPDPPPVRPPERQPEPPPVQRTIRPAPETVEPPAPRRPQVSLTPVVRNPNARTQPDTRARERARDEGESRQRRESINQSLARIRADTGGRVEIGEVLGPGGGGPSYASFEAVLRSVYFHNWREPSDATLADAVVLATVTIARDGSVLSARITQGSGDPAVDRSVRRVLDDVTFIAPFPPGAREQQRTYPLSFSLRAKRGLG